MKNMELARRVVEELVFAGVREFCLCAGARNSPLVYLLEQSKDLMVYNFFEERSAAFFALGRIVATDRPVAVITTSGTAVAELLPAAIEATYSSVPLILISADRPKTYRGSGAPQTIEQVGMFSYYIEATFDLDEENSHISLKRLTYKKPIHINICFKEPLLDIPIDPVPVLEKTSPQRFPESADMKERQIVRDFLKEHTPLIILGYIPSQFKNIVKNFLMRLSLPIYAETTSGLRNDPDLAHLVLKSGEAFVPKLFEKKYFDSVFRIGGVPTLRFWRDLEDKYQETPVLSLSYNYYTGLSREVTHFADLHFLDYIHDSYERTFQEVFQWDQELYQKMQNVIEKYPLSEPALIHKLSNHLNFQSLYLGNSLPIREWDLTSSYKTQYSSVYANRGANGIDGQISTFLGWSKKFEKNWCVVGDLTALYDLSAPWILNQLSTAQRNILVINNKGGQIFKRVFKKNIFLNSHNLNFSHWANMWSMQYHQWLDIPEEFNFTDRNIIELNPDAQQTELFWNELDQIY